MKPDSHEAGRLLRSRSCPPAKETEATAAVAYGSQPGKTASSPAPTSQQMKKLPFLLIVTLSGCSTVEQKRVSDFINSPAGQAIVRIAASTGSKAIDQYASTGKLNGKEIAQAALSGASAELRKAEIPGTPANASAAKQAVQVA